MKENQNSASFGSESFGTKETLELNDSKIHNSPIAFEAKDRDDSLDWKVVDDFSIDNENGAADSPTKGGENGDSHNLSGWDKDADSLSSDSFDMGKEQRSPDHESLVKVPEFAGNDPGDSSSLGDGAPDLFEADATLFTDKNVLECEVPELEVCYKEIDCQILKDICVDEGRLQKDITVVEICKDENPDQLFPQPPDGKDHFESTEDLSPEYTIGLNANQCGSKEEEKDKNVVSQGRLEASLDKSFKKDTDPQDSLQKGEANCSTTGKAEIDSSAEGSLVDRKLSVEDFGEAYMFMQPPDQILNEKMVSEIPPTSSAAAGESGEDVQDDSRLYNSKVESQSITFNFNSPVPEIVEGSNTVAENVNKKSADSEDANTDNPSDAGVAQCTSNIIENVHEQSLVIKDSSGENSHEQSTEHKDATNSDSSTGGPVQSPSNDVQAVEPNVPQHEQRNSGAVSVVGQSSHDVGETSFSAASLITYSGPIAFSGSLSHRSDGSTTSGKSFAFPVLQSEWNSSPVRMAKPDRRHFRKHKGWRSGLLCCRF